MKECGEGKIQNEITQYISKQGNLEMNCRDVTINEELYTFLTKYELILRVPSWGFDVLLPITDNLRSKNMVVIGRIKKRRVIWDKGYVKFTLAFSVDNTWYATIYEDFDENVKIINSIAFVFKRVIEIQDRSKDNKNGYSFRQWKKANKPVIFDYE